MGLTFTKDGNAYVATFEATSDFNLHLELPERGLVSVQQRTTSSGKYAPVKGMERYNFDTILDVDFGGGIYPKSIKVMCASKPSVAEVTMS